MLFTKTVAALALIVALASATKMDKCMSRGYSYNQCYSYTHKSGGCTYNCGTSSYGYGHDYGHYGHRNLKTIDASQLVKSNAECSKAHYDMHLVVQGAHFAGLATPKDGSSCPSIVFHAEPQEDDQLQKVSLEVHEEHLVELEDDQKLHLGTKPLIEIVQAFETAPVSKEGLLYDAISNNCVVMLRNMADPLDIPVDQRMIGFITKKLTSDASAHIVDMMKESPAIQMIYEGSRRMLKGVSTEDLVAKVIQLYV